MAEAAKGKRKPSLSLQIIIVMIILNVVLVGNIVAGVIVQYNQCVNNVQRMLSENLDAALSMAENGFKNVVVLMNDHSYDYEFVSGSDEQKTEHLIAVAGYDNDLLSLSYIDEDGNLYGPEVPASLISTAASKGTAMIEPTDENGTFYIALNNGHGTLVAYLNASKLTSLITGSASDVFILGKDGTVIAAVSKTGAYEKSYNNYINTSKGSQKIDLVSTKYGDTYYVHASEYIDGTDGLSIMIRAKSGEYYSSIMIAVVLGAFQTVVASILCILIVATIRRTLIKAIKDVCGKLQEMENGNLNSAPLKNYTTRELSDLASSVNELNEINKSIVADIARVADAIAHEDLTVHTSAQYSGDFVPVRNSLESIIDSVRTVVINVDTAANKVSESSSQMSSNSAVLSTAASEQDSTVLQLNDSLNGVHALINDSAVKASKALQVAENTVAAMDQGNAKMESMLAAMNEINESSSQIANIIKAIQDISFQTNILSLNASIEAARAGEAGKGFAVVAGEVSTLADKTSEAAKSTTKLIENSLKAVEHGAVIANESADVLKEIAKQALESADVVKDIAETANKQTDAINQVMDGMNRISTSVSQINNSASECADSSQVLSEESTLLRDTISGFVIDERAPRHASKIAAAPAPAPSPAPAHSNNSFDNSKSTSASASNNIAYESPKTSPVSSNSSISLPGEQPNFSARSKQITLPGDKKPKQPKPAKPEKPAKIEKPAKAEKPKVEKTKSEKPPKPVKPAKDTTMTPKAAAPAKSAISITLPDDKPASAGPKPVTASTFAKAIDAEITQIDTSKAISKATMQPVKRTIHMDNDKY